MIDIRSNFFYTRSVPCQLWFFNKAKPIEHRDKVLMIDARNIFRKVTRKIYDFTPEQLANITAIVWLYRGQTERFVELAQKYVDQTLTEAETGTGRLAEFTTSLDALHTAMQSFLDSQPEDGKHAKDHADLLTTVKELGDAGTSFVRLHKNTRKQFHKKNYPTAPELLKFIESDLSNAELSKQSSDLVKLIDLAFKLITRLLEHCEKELNAKKSSL